MPDDLLDLADRLYTGDLDVADHPFAADFGRRAEIAPDLAFVAGFSNVSALVTDDGLVMIDTGSTFLAELIHTTLREWTDRALHTAVFTHGHIDHCFGIERYEADAERRGAPRPRVVAHEAILERFARYRLTAGYNQVVNQRQFANDRIRWPTEFRVPDETYRDALRLEVGGQRLELHHARGETDDHTWVWLPDRKTVLVGDLFIWASPNCGNPQKVQRYPAEWAAALRRIATLAPEVLLPGHGYPIVGAERVARALDDAATLLESLHSQTLALMNEGARLDDILAAVVYPEELLARPYLRPVYDEPEFVVRSVWRLYGGWWDGNPARLKPAPDAAVAAEVATLAGGSSSLTTRARELAAGGELRLAAQLAEWAVQAEPGDTDAHRTRAEVYEARVRAEASTMSTGIFGWAAMESRRILDG